MQSEGALLESNSLSKRVPSPCNSRASWKTDEENAGRLAPSGPELGPEHTGQRTITQTQPKQAQHMGSRETRRHTPDCYGDILRSFPSLAEDRTNCIGSRVSTEITAAVGFDARFDGSHAERERSTRLHDLIYSTEYR